MTSFAFQPGPTGSRTGLTHAAPEPGREPEPLPEREWGLSAAQVVVAVLAIVAACEAIGALL